VCACACVGHHEGYTVARRAGLAGWVEKFLAADADPDFTVVRTARRRCGSAATENTQNQCVYSLAEYLISVSRNFT